MLVATAVTPGMTAPLGSVTTPEIEPVTEHHAMDAPATTATATSKLRKVMRLKSHAICRLLLIELDRTPAKTTGRFSISLQLKGAGSSICVS
jgi:hypothetical protein